MKVFSYFLMNTIRYIVHRMFAAKKSTGPDQRDPGRQSGQGEGAEHGQRQQQQPERAQSPRHPKQSRARARTRTSALISRTSLQGSRRCCHARALNHKCVSGK
jgi:hypothetical protein